jgi:lipopolysaccharide transport system permease protein
MPLKYNEMQKVTIVANTPVKLNLKELFNYRDLFLVLAYRDFKVRYTQTVLGFFWAFLQPAATLMIFVLVFGRTMKVPVGNYSYTVFALSGLVCWTYIAYVMTQSGNSIIHSQNMVKKIYFPRLIIPLSKGLVGIVDFLIAFLFLIVIMVYNQVLPSKNIIWLPLVIILTLIISAGVGIWLSALMLRYRDVQHMIPFIVQIGLYATPIAYPSSMIPEVFQTIYHLNPMVGLIESFRWCLMGDGSITIHTIISFVIGIILFVSSFFYFKKVERTMVDIL